MNEQLGTKQEKFDVTNILDFDLQRKRKLAEIYDDILMLEHDLKHEKNLLEELNTEFGDFHTAIPTTKEILLEAECPIIIAGETSSGKSGFINLLIGSNVLPVSTLTCTSTIIKLHNATKKEILITKENGEVKHIEFDFDAEPSTIQKKVKKYGNTIIVDTPGIDSSHNPELTARLFEYLPRAVAFIYIIDSSRAGGIEKDRLLAIFEEQRNWKQSGKLVEFDVSKTVFVCNKWDIVEEEDDDDDVFTYIKEKLRDNWPNFHEQQLFKLSVKEERQLAKQGKSSENYQKLLHGIGKMVPDSLEAKVVMNISWQTGFLTSTINRTFGRIRLSMKGLSEVKELTNTAERRLFILQKKISEVEQNVTKYTEDRCKQLSKTVSLHLNNPKTMKRIFQWSAEQLDCHSLSFVEMKYLGMKMIKSRIERELKGFWEREQIRKLSSDFENFLFEQLLLFDEQSRAVRTLICNIRNHKVTSPEINVRPGISLLGIIAFGAVAVITAPLWVPFSLIAARRSFAIEDAIRSENIKRIAEFKSRPLVFMMEWCKEMLQHDYSEDKIYQRLECEFIQSFGQTVRHVCGKIVPQQIKADKMFIKNVANDSRPYKEIRNVYFPLCENAKVIMGKLLIIYMEYFSHYAVETEDLRSYSGARKWDGRFARVHEIEMSSGERWVKAVVKTMKQPLNTDDSLIQLTEVDSLM